MQNIIQLLPDAIANQIAAGEVVQRPASVVKELLENAVDAGATKVDLYIKNAGKTLIQVTDNGAGMSASDARMAFERHATSKIREQDDLFNIRTLGFRGEALASIAAVAQVRLRTRLQSAEIGLELDIEASKVVRNEAWAGPAGSTFMVRNLFFNVPARRNFLKSNPVETRHIINEFLRVALPHPDIHLTLQHNDTLVYDLPPGDTAQRLIHLFGKELEGNLIQLEEATGYANFSGFMASPEVYRKNRGEQFFFVNGRYIRSNYLNHAVCGAFEEFLPKDTYPFYCIFLSIDPVHVDINIHPTKTEVKFDDERTLYVLLQGLVKRGLAESHHTPEFDFGDSALQQAIYQSGSVPLSPENPSPPISSGSSHSTRERNFPPQRQTIRKADWEDLYKPAEPVNPARTEQTQLPIAPTPRRTSTEEIPFLVQYQGRYLVTQFDESLVIINQNLAHQRVLYERFVTAGKGSPTPSQQLLFPQTLEFAAADYVLLLEVDDLLKQMGFEVKEFGRHTLIVYGTPVGVGTSKIRELFEEIVEDLRMGGGGGSTEKPLLAMARAIASRCAIPSDHKMETAEMQRLVSDLFKCEAPAYAPNGRPTMKKIAEVELESFFK